MALEESNDTCLEKLDSETSLKKHPPPQFLIMCVLSFSLGFFYLLSPSNCVLLLYSQSQDQAVAQQEAGRSSAGVWPLKDSDSKRIQPL